MLLFVIFARGLGEEAISTIGLANITIVALAGAVGMGAGPLTIRLFAQAGLREEDRWREAVLPSWLSDVCRTSPRMNWDSHLLPQENRDRRDHSC